MAVTSLALAVSITEEQFGFDAIRVGWSLMEGRRLSGWALSGLFVLVSNLISWKVVRKMDSWDLSKGVSTALVRWLWDNVGWECLYGLVVLWSYVITTVFYWECRRRKAIKDETDSAV
ncbi:unnamed protein product [Ilex paraguariensis]